MDHGKLLALDTPAALMRSLAGESDARARRRQARRRRPSSTRSPRCRRVERVEQLQGSPEDGDGASAVRLYVAGDAPLLVAPAAAVLAEHGLALNDVRLGTPTLEDVFIHLTGRTLR